MKRLILLVCVLLIYLTGMASAQLPATLNDRWFQSWQNCGGQPCLNMQLANASGAWTGGGSLNDLWFQAFSTCGGTPCLVASIGGGTPLPYAQGGTNSAGPWTPGSVVFIGPTSFAQNNAKFFWDNTNFRLGINTTTPVASLDLQVTDGINLPGNGSGYHFSNNTNFGMSVVNGTTDITLTSFSNLILQSFNGTAYVPGLTLTGNGGPLVLKVATGVPIASATAGGTTVGSASLPFSSVYVGGAATNNIQLTGTATAARVLTAPDRTGTIITSGDVGTVTNTMLATTPTQTVSATRPNQALTNNAAADADFNSVYTIPANTLITNQWIRINFFYKIVAGATPATETWYLKLGATKVYIAASTLTPVNATRYFFIECVLIGTAAAGASVAVDASCQPVSVGSAVTNTVNATVATNGTLTIVPGITWGSASGADTLTLVDVSVQMQ